MKAKLWTLPKGRVKNDKGHTVPLSDPAIAILETLPHVAGGRRLVFTTTGTTQVSGFTNVKEKIDRILARKAGEEEIAGWTFHDLRRTMASGCARFGIAPQIVEAILNHKRAEGFGPLNANATVMSILGEAEKTITGGNAQNEISLRRGIEELVTICQKIETEHELDLGKVRLYILGAIESAFVIGTEAGPAAVNSFKRLQRERQGGRASGSTRSKRAEDEWRMQARQLRSKILKTKPYIKTAALARAVHQDLNPSRRPENLRTVERYLKMIAETNL